MKQIITDKQRKLDEIFLNIAHEIAQLSKCVSFQVGSVLVKDGRIVSTGYNGSPVGFTNCSEKFGGDFKREEHHEWSNMYEIHSEMNAVLFSARNGISTEGATLYCTLKPCHNCLKNLVQAGIKRIVYKQEYDKSQYTDETIKMIEISGIDFVKF